MPYPAFTQEPTHRHQHPWHISPGHSYYYCVKDNHMLVWHLSRPPPPSPPSTLPSNRPSINNSFIRLQPTASRTNSINSSNFLGVSSFDRLMMQFAKVELHPSVHASINKFIHPCFIHLSIYLSSIHPPIHLFIHQSIYPLTHPSVRPFTISS